MASSRHVSEPGMITSGYHTKQVSELKIPFHTVLIPDGIHGPTHHHVQKGCSIKIVHDDKNLKNALIAEITEHTEQTPSPFRKLSLLSSNPKF